MRDAHCVFDLPRGIARNFRGLVDLVCRLTQAVKIKAAAEQVPLHQQHHYAITIGAVHAIQIVVVAVARLGLNARRPERTRQLALRDSLINIRIGGFQRRVITEADFHRLVNGCRHITRSFFNGRQEYRVTAHHAMVGNFRVAQRTFSGLHIGHRQRHARFDLIEVGFTSHAFVDAQLNLVKRALVRRKVFLGKHHQLFVFKHLGVGIHRLQRNVFRCTMHLVRRRIGYRTTALYFGACAQAIPQHLVSHHGINLPIHAYPLVAGGQGS